MEIIKNPGASIGVGQLDLIGVRQGPKMRRLEMTRPRGPTRVTVSFAAIDPPGKAICGLRSWCLTKQGLDRLLSQMTMPRTNVDHQGVGSLRSLRHWLPHPLVDSLLDPVLNNCTMEET